ncbi:MAG TPA: PKD domain-containing protein [Flavobacteriales bacterium]
MPAPHRALLQALLTFVVLLLPGIVRGQFTVNAGLDRTICAGTVTNLGGSPTATGPGPYTYQWTPTTGLSSATVANPTATVNANTTYTVSVTDNSTPPNTVTDQVNVSVNALPTIQLTSPNAEQSTTYNGLPAFSLCQQGFSSFAFDFTDASSASAGSTYTITWGNGNSNTYATSGWNATQTYPLGLTQGTYTITQPNGCTRTTQFYVFIGGVPLGGLSVVTGTSICTGQTVDFQWNNIGTNPPGTTYIIDFGDGQTSNVPHPPPAVIQHTYNVSSCDNGGEFSAAWRIQNPCDTRTGQLDQIRVSESSQANFTISPNDTVCVNSPVTLTDQSIGQQAPTCTDPKRVWSIMPNTYALVSGSLGSTGGTPAVPATWTNGSTTLSVQFTAPGTYTISDLTGNVCGQNTLTRTICVEAPPSPAFTLSPATGCSPLVSTADNTSSSPNSCLTRYNWQLTNTSASCNSGASAAFSNGTSSGTFEPQFTFTGAGTYNVRLQAINSCGTFPVDRVVSVGAPPQVALAAVPGICAGGSVSPQATFTSCGTPITGYTWAMPGGAPSAASTAMPGTITYTSPGNYTITAGATSLCGPGNASTPLVVTTLPAAPVLNGPLNICAGEDIVLQATAVNGVSFTWSGPGGFSQVGNTITRTNATAAMAGVYTVVPNGGGCSGPSSTVQVTVTPTPVISITPAAPAVCQGQPVTLTAGGGGNYSWTVGGVPQGTGPSITFTPTGTQPVVVTSAQGNCPGSSNTTVTVNPLPVVDAGPDRTFCAQAIPEILQPPTPGGIWSGAGVTAGGSFTPSGAGTFTLTYTVTSAAGCSSSDVVQVTVDPVPADPVVGNDTLVCLNSGPLVLSASPPGGTWSGNVSSNGTFTPNTAGTFPLTYMLGSGSCTVSASLQVQVVNAAVVNAGADLVRCIDAPPVLLNATPMNGTWTGAGITGNTFAPSAASTGVHVLTYTYMDPNGCAVSDALNATVHALPVVTAGNDIIFCDQPLPQQLTGFSPANGIWSGANVTSGGVFTPAGVGISPLTYTYTDVNNCSASSQITATVIAIDEPADAGADDALCIGSTDLVLSGLPTGGIWSGPAVTAGGVFTPDAAGDHTLTYSVGTGSCITSDQVVITVDPLPIVAITSSTSVCLDGGAQTLTATPLGGTWSGPGIMDAAMGTFDPLVPGVGSFTVTYAYTDANGCTNNTSAQATVNPLPVAAFSNAPIACMGASFPFTDASSGNTGWEWDFGDGGTSNAASPQHTYSSTGTYPVTLTVSTGPGCTHSTTGSVTVWEGPTVAFSAGPETAGCGPLTVEVQNNSFGDGVSYAWDFGNGEMSTTEQPAPVTFLASAYTDTVYTITLSASNLCSTVDRTIDITVFPAPTALFGPDFDQGCSPWPVTFSNVSIGQADAFHWDFGDGTELQTMDSLVTHTYFTGANDTTFTITLTATNTCGTDVHTYDVTVQPNTITAFFNTSTTNGCAPLTVDLTQYSIGVTNWHWELGDGNVSTAQDVTHTYSAGTWTATLYGDNGCSYDTVSVTIEVSPSPTVSFSIDPQPVCLGLPVQLTNLTPEVSSTNWDLGAEGTSTFGTLPVVFDASGSWPVTLTVTAIDNGCTASATQWVQVVQPPNAAFSVNEPIYCAPTPLVFTNTSIGSNLASTWTQDGTVFSFLEQPLPQNTTATGTHTVALLVVDQLTGCRDSTNMDIVGNPSPDAGLVLQPVDPCGRPAEIIATNSSTPGATVSWWLDGVLVGTQGQLELELIGAGEHALELVAELQGPCTDTARTSFVLHELPIAAFTTDTACVGQSIPLVDQSEFTLAQWWYFNGSLVGSSANTLAMAPEELGPDTIALSVIGEGGCRDSTQRIVNAYSAPIAAFTAIPQEDCRTIALTATEQPLSRYHWTVHGTPASEDRYWDHFYDPGTTGTIPFQLLVTNIHGCSDSLYRPVEVPTCVHIPNAFTPNDDGINELFLPSILPFERLLFMRIYDRWGHVVKELTVNDPVWDGTANGEELPIGVYNWVLSYGTTAGASEEMRGHVTLVR